MKTFFALLMFAGAALMSTGISGGAWLGFKMAMAGLIGEACAWLLP